MALLKLSDPYSAILSILPQPLEMGDGCETADFVANELKLDPNITIGEMIDRSIPYIDEEGYEWMERSFSASIRCRELWDGLIDTEVREKYCEALRTPFTAFMVYIMVDALTSSEDAILESKFTGKLPNAEKELMAGIVTRAKTTNSVG